MTVPNQRRTKPGSRGTASAFSNGGGPGGRIAPRRPNPITQRRRRRRIVVLLTGVGLFVVAAVLVVYAYMITPIPSVNDISKAQTTIFYYADGKNEIDRVSEVNRESIPLAQVPVPVRNAMLAAEDREFYSNPGVSVSGLARAVWIAVRGGPTQGGSTITQQYVKNSRLSQEQTLTRKAKELIISLKIEREQSKDQILENYLNTIYYGRGAYGIKTAARAYFGKEVAQLSVPEAALLASVVRGPSYYDPDLGARQLQNAKARVNYVLDGMVEQGWLSKTARSRAKFPTVIKPKRARGRSGPGGYLSDVVRTELVRRGIATEDQVDRGGLRVVTTLDRGMQERAVEAVTQYRPNSGKAAGIHVALASVKPGDGAILALYGGRDFATRQFNDATQGHFQGGSTFKVFTLVAALQKGISTKTVYDGNSPVRIKEFESPDNPSGEVQNFGGHGYGPLTLKQATAKSSNTVYVRLNVDVGSQNTARVARLLGLPAAKGTDPDESTPGLADNVANVFGTASVRPIDMAEAYATFAAKGVHTEPRVVDQVTSVDGSITYEASRGGQRVIDEPVAADAVDAMREVLRSGTASGASFGRPAAGKTGTTTENRAVWFTGFTPQVSTAVAMYYPDAAGNAQPMRNIAGLSEVTGATYPVRIWSAFMRSAHQGLPVMDFPPRAGIGDDKLPPPMTQTSAPTETFTDSPTTSTPSGSSSTWSWTPSTGPSAIPSSGEPPTSTGRASNSDPTAERSGERGRSGAGSEPLPGPGLRTTTEPEPGSEP